MTDTRKFLIVALLFLFCSMAGCTEATEGSQDTPMRYAIDASILHSYAIDGDGVLWFWGTTVGREVRDTEDPRFEDFFVPDPRVIMEDVVSVSAGETFTLILKSDGSVWGWGALPDTAQEDMFNPPEMLMENVTAICSRGQRHLAVDADGVLWNWGSADRILRMVEAAESGESPPETPPGGSAPVELLRDVQCVSASYTHVLAIRTDNTLWSWGNNDAGQLGNGTRDSSAQPSQILEDVQFVSAGEDMSAAITSDGKLWAWGKNDWGLLSSDPGPVSEPTWIADDVVHVSAGRSDDYYTILYITGDGALWLRGYDIRTDDHATEARKVMDGAAQVSVCPSHILVLTTEGEVLGWGDNTTAALAGCGAEFSADPVAIALE